MAVLPRIMANNGGRVPWEVHRYLQLRLSFGGLAFALKWNKAGTTTRDILIDISNQKVTFYDFPSKGKIGTWQSGAVSIDTWVRHKPREYFSHWRRTFYWDDLDLLYFAGYACFNYFVFPYILVNQHCQVMSTQKVTYQNKSLLRLDVEFGSEMPTHSQYQAFYFDAEGRLIRHDYNPEVFMLSAKAAHLCFHHTKVNGVWFPIQRKVLPRKSDGGHASRPILVWINVESIQFLKEKN